MNRRDLLGSAGALALTGLFTSAGSAKGDARTARLPNFVLIMCDDLGFGDIQPYGGIIPTPNINRLAAEGVTLDNYYAPANLCTPSRAGLLTGKHPIRTGLGWEVLLETDARGLSVSERTIANELAPRYASALIGKWHLGTAPQYWPPTRHGFDLFYGIPYSHDMTPLALFESHAGSDVVTSQPADLASLQQNFCRRAEAFIDEHRAKPFFLELALSAPHLPTAPSEAFRHTSKAGSYGDVIREIDAIVGRIVDKVDALGLSQNTLIMFTSDNGPWFEGSPGPLRDRKGGGAYDGGSHVPFLARMPRTLAPATRTKAIVSGLDILPTLCAMAGVTPDGGERDGQDIQAVLKGSATSPRDEIVLFNNEAVVGIRTQRWKYVSETYYRGGRTDYVERGYPQLYDMELEQGENYSVADLYPDILADMQARWRAAVAKFAPFRTPRPKGFDWVSQ
jgi:arylsulfatase A-like enzyme